MPAGGEDHSLGMENMQFSGGEFHRHHAGRGSIHHDQIDHLEFIMEGDIILDALLVKGLQNHMPGAIGSMGCTCHRQLGVIIGVPAKGTLRNLAFWRAVKGQAHMFQFVDRRDGFFAHKFNGILITQVIAAFDGIKGMPLGVVFLGTPRAAPTPP